MKNPQKGFVAPLLIGIIALLVIGGGVYIYKTKKAEAPFVYDTALQSDQVQQTNTENYSINNQQNTTIKTTPSSNPVSVKPPMVVSSSTASVPLNISPNTLLDASIDPPNQRLDSTYYNQRLTAAGFTKPGLKWDIVQGSLPSGILIGKVNIVCANQSACDSTKETYQASLTGRPKNVGEFTFTVRATSGNQSVEKTYTLSVTNYSSIEVKSVYPNHADAGSITGITVLGYGFVKGSSELVFTGNGITKQVDPYSVSSDGTQITSAVPRDLTAGIYDISVINITNGVQKSSINSVRFNLGKL